MYNKIHQTKSKKEIKDNLRQKASEKMIEDRTQRKSAGKVTVEEGPYGYKI